MASFLLGLALIGMAVVMSREVIFSLRRSKQERQQIILANEPDPIPTYYLPARRIPTDWKAVYWKGTKIVGWLSFVVYWLFALMGDGLLMGGVVGIIPAAIGAVITGLGWPLTVPLVIWIAYRLL